MVIADSNYLIKIEGEKECQLQERNIQSCLFTSGWSVEELKRHVVQLQFLWRPPDAAATKQLSALKWTGKPQIPPHGLKSQFAQTWHLISKPKQDSVVLSHEKVKWKRQVFMSSNGTFTFNSHTITLNNLLWQCNFFFFSPGRLIFNLFLPLLHFSVLLQRWKCAKSWEQYGRLMTPGWNREKVI